VWGWVGVEVEFLLFAVNLILSALDFVTKGVTSVIFVKGF
jgi:hypothetical protein